MKTRLTMLFAAVALLGVALAQISYNGAAGKVELHPALHGWQDIMVSPVLHVTGSTTKDPTFTKWFDNGAGSRGVSLYTFDDNGTHEKELYFTLQLNHNMQAGAAIHSHVHWIGSTTETAKVNWGLECTTAEPTAVYGNSAIVYAKDLEDGTSVVTQYKHNITEFPTVTPSATQDGLSTVMICRMFRNSSNATDDTYTGSAGVLSIDAHYLTDFLGSRSEYIK